MSKPWLDKLQQRVKTPPKRLLAVGFDEPLGPLLGAVEHLSIDRLAAIDGDAVDGDGFDWIVLHVPDDGLSEDLSKIAAVCAERARVAWILPHEGRRDAILALSQAGFAVQDEASGEDPENSKSGRWALVLTRPTDFIVRAFEAGDEIDILTMFKPSFHVERSEAHWRWKFEDQPFGSHLITVARAPSGELAAHYAGYPVIFESFETEGRRPKSRTFVGLQIGDTMTLPKFRTVGRGPTSLLGRAVRHFFAAYCEDQVAFNFGFNTGNIQKFSRRFVRAELVEKLGYWVRPEGVPPESSRTYRVERVEETGPAWDRFFRKVGPSYGLLVRRDSRWLRWRYLDCPDEPPFLVLAARRWGRLVGWSVFRRHKDSLRWCDALFDQRHVEASWALLRAAVEAPEMQGIQGIEAWFPTRPEWWRRQLIALGFEPAEQPDNLAVMTVPFEMDSGTLLKDWYYTMGDGDLA